MDNQRKRGYDHLFASPNDRVVNGRKPLTGFLVALFDGEEYTCGVTHDRGLRQLNSEVHDYTVIRTATHEVADVLRESFKYSWVFRERHQTTVIDDTTDARRILR